MRTGCPLPSPSPLPKSGRGGTALEVHLIKGKVMTWGWGTGEKGIPRK